jgi:hypothetical protein
MFQMPRIIGIMEMAKTAFLESLRPYYVQASEQDRLDEFFDTLIVIWADRYPIDAFCDPVFRGDPLYYEWAIMNIKAVSFTISHQHELFTNMV